MGKQRTAAISRSDLFTEEDRRIIVTLLDSERWQASLPPSTYLDAIHQDRESPDYEDDTDGVNPPSLAYRLASGRV